MSAAEDLRRIEQAMREALAKHPENSEAAVRDVQRRLERQQTNGGAK